MASLVDYIVLFDGSFELEGSLDSRVIEFTLPNDYVAGTNLAKPILMFQVNPLTDNVRVHTGFNSPQLLQSDAELQLVFPNGPHMDHGQWECVRGNRLSAGTNTCYFLNRNASSRCRIRDVILWFQRNQ